VALRQRWEFKRLAAVAPHWEVPIIFSIDGYIRAWNCSGDDCSANSSGTWNMLGYAGPSVVDLTTQLQRTGNSTVFIIWGTVGQGDLWSLDVLTQMWKSYPPTPPANRLTKVTMGNGPVVWALTASHQVWTIDTSVAQPKWRVFENGDYFTDLSVNSQNMLVLGSPKVNGGYTPWSESVSHSLWTKYPNVHASLCTIGGTGGGVYDDKGPFVATTDGAAGNAIMRYRGGGSWQGGPDGSFNMGRVYGLTTVGAGSSNDDCGGYTVGNDSNNTASQGYR
jgi:hypothetical protein